MNKMISVVAVSILVSACATPAPNPPPGHSVGMQGASMDMMQQERMTAMNKHLQSMRETMDRIQKESDPQKRQTLMQEHMAQITKGMQMMEMMRQEGKDMMPMSDMMEMMSKRMGKMHENMGMMQMMMGQMQMHEAEEHNHKQ